MSRPWTLTYVEQAAPVADSGLWNHPDSDPEAYRDPAYWVDLAQTLERAGFAALFLADQPSAGSDVATQHRQQLHSGAAPRLDPAYLLPLLARCTTSLGFVITSSVTYDQPYPLARRFATLDHLTDGRVGWNVVTTNARQAALNHSMPELLEHDLRYDRAEEFLAAAYALWNHSWDDDAVVRDHERGVYVDPERVRAVHHSGEHFRVDGIPVFPPSPQRTPVLFQAGSSERGRQFAARHAEVVYLNAVSTEETARLVSDVRARAAALGRDPGSLRFLPRTIPVTAPTREEARHKYEAFVDHHDPSNAAFVLKQWAGLDVSELPATGPLDLDGIDVDGLTSQHTADHLRRLSRSGVRFTRDELLRAYAFGGEGNVLVGTGEDVVDAWEEFVEATGVDGFNVAYMLRRHSLDDFVRDVVPVLRRRGLLAPAPEVGAPRRTLRERLSGRAAVLPPDHPGQRGAGSASRRRSS